MKKQFLLFVFLLTGSYLQVFAQFNSIFQIPNGRIEDISFSDWNYTHGWAAEGGGVVYKTSNGGLSWDTVLSNPVRYFRCVDFVSPDVGFASSLDSVMYRSSDAGDTWTEIPRNTFPADFSGVCGMDHSNGVLYGAGYYGGSPYVIKTTDQGATWSTTDLSAQCSGLVDVVCISSTEVIVSGNKNTYDEGIILRSTDGGSTFTEVFQTNNLWGSVNIWKMFRLDHTDTIFASVERLASDTMYFLKSTDAGQTWTSYYAGIQFTNIQAIGFINSAHGFMSGYFPGFLETTDGGVTWSHVFGSGNNFFFRGDRFCKRPYGDMFAGGNGIFYLGNSLTVPEQSPGDMGPLHTLEVFPNPVLNTLQLRVELTSHTLVSLNLFDLSGKLIKNIWKQNLPSGIYSVSADVSDLQAGSYYIAMHTNLNHVVKPVIKN